MANTFTSDNTNQNKSLKPFGILIGRWSVVGRHPLLPGVELEGSTTFQWIEDGAFIKMNNSIKHKDFPDGISILGSDDSGPECRMLYYDSRGLSRIYKCSLTDNIWKWWRDKMIANFPSISIVRLPKMEIQLFQRVKCQKMAAPGKETSNLSIPVLGLNDFTNRPGIMINIYLTASRCAKKGC